MRITGIVAEYNPFHNGHEYLLNTARENGADAVIAAMSGNWVQRGDTAIISKFARTRQALECGVDLVAEIPTFWAMSTAQKFALGAVTILENLGADTLAFGSEWEIRKESSRLRTAFARLNFQNICVSC